MSSSKTTTGARPQTFTAAQVGEHKGRNDNWIIVQGQVLDISKYIDDHPGGADILVECAGQDASEEFNNAGHSEDALEIMDEFRVGFLDGYKKPAPKRIMPIVPVSQPSSKPSSSASKPATNTTPLAISSSLATLSAVYCYNNLDMAVVSSTTRVLTATAQKLLKQIFSHLPSTSFTTTNGGFTTGFLAASALTTLLTTLMAKRILTRLTHIDHGFIRFPSHRPSKSKPPIAPPAPFLNPQTYLPLPLITKTEIAPSIYLLTFRLPTPTTPLGLPTGQHVAIKATLPSGETVTRSYTPISNNSDLGLLTLLIRVYPTGLLTSQFFAKLTPGVDSVLFRGPKGAMRYHRSLAPRIGMVAGGTGITPMYQVIRAICEDPEDHTEISLVYASRTEGDILLRKELEGFRERYPGNLKGLWYMLDVEPEHGGWEYGVGYVNAQVLEERMPKAGGGSKVFLCGPPGLVNGAKKALGGMGYALPGAVGRMEDEIFCF